jgi:hypothetical protein
MFDKPDVTHLVNQITADVRGIIADEVALAKEEFKPTIKRAAAGSGLFIAALVCALVAALLLWFLVAAGFAWLYASVTVWSAWACVFVGMATAAVVALVIAVLAGLIGYGRFKGIHAPERDPESRNQTIAAIKDGIAQGKALVAREIHDPHAGALQRQVSEP